MSDDREVASTARKRLLGQPERMVKAGRVTEREAARLRAAGTPEEFDETVRAIRVRHAGAHLAEAVEGGEMTEQEATAHPEGLRGGEHPSSLRAQPHTLRRRAR